MMSEMGIEEFAKPITKLIRDSAEARQAIKRLRRRLECRGGSPAD